MKDSNVNVKVSIKNQGSDGSMYIECGIYSESTLKSWGTFSVYQTLDAPNCVGYETNVDTRQVNLCEGQTTTVSLTMKATKYAYEQYYVFCDTYERCRRNEADTGSSDDKYNIITIPGTPDTATCTDSHINQDETDTDCGGLICDKCPLAYKCKTNSDCESADCNSEGYCDKKDLLKCSLPLDRACDLPYALPGTDDSQQSSECETGWCKDVFSGILHTPGDLGKCASVPYGRDGHSDCVEEGFDFGGSINIAGIDIPYWGIGLGFILLIVLLRRKK